MKLSILFAKEIFQGFLYTVDVSKAATIIIGMIWYHSYITRIWYNTILPNLNDAKVESPMYRNLALQDGSRYVTWIKPLKQLSLFLKLVKHNILWESANTCQLQSIILRNNS